MSKMLSDKQNISSLVSSSNLARLCGARNRAQDYVHLREEAELQAHHKQLEEAPAANQLAAADEVTRLARILLRLVNDTFLALPIEQCRPLSSAASVRYAVNGPDHDADHDQEGGQGSHHDACLVDWNRASLIDLNGASDLSSPLPLPPIQKNDSSQSAGAAIAKNSIIESSWSRLNFMNTTTNAATASQRTIISPIECDYVKFTYLSMSSLLSVFGILVNLFIILIIIFNTKQKRRSIIRSNNTNQNNLLLFQLTLTGILLSSHVLLENLSIQNTTDPDTGPQESTTLELDPWSMAPQPPATRQYSNLFNFLPPTPFHATTTMQPVPRLPIDTYPALHLDPDHLCVSCDDDPEDLLEVSESGSAGGRQRVRIRNKFALVLSFASHSDQLKDDKESTKSSERQPPEGSWYLEYHVSSSSELRQPLKDSRLINLSNSLASMSVGKLSGPCSSRHHCIEQQQSNNREARGSSVNNHPAPEITGIAEDGRTGRWEQHSGLLALIAILLPWSMNVLASVHILTVAALAYDRYCAIAHPLHYLRSIHTSKVRKFFILSWTVAILLNLLWPLTLNQIQSRLGLDASASVVAHQDNPERVSTNRTWWVTVNATPDRSAWPTDRADTIDAMNGSQYRSESDSSHRYLVVFETGCSANIVSHYNKSNDCRLASRKSSSDTYRSLRMALSQFLYDLDRPQQTGNETGQTIVDDTSTSYNKTAGSLVEDLRMLQGWIKLRNTLMVELASLLIGQPVNISRKHNDSSSDLKLLLQSTGDKVEAGGASSLYIIFLLAYSFFSFLVIILVPLLIITICNISIYRIVKVHERRLSINSGSNVNTSASNLNTGAPSQPGSHHHHCKYQQQVRVHRCRENVPDDRSETGSITSLVMGKLMKVGFLFGARQAKAATKLDDERVYESYPIDQEAGQQQLSCSRLTSASNCNNKLCGCDMRNNLSNSALSEDTNNKNEQQLVNHYKLPASSSSSNIVNRSKRKMMIRQESYHQPSMANRLNSSSGADDACRYDEPLSRNSFCAKSESNLPLGFSKQHSTQPVISPPFRRQRIKRKASDQTLRDLSSLRKDSNTSQLSDYRDSDNLADNCSLFNDSLPSRLQNDIRGYQDPASSGIMNQIKLAGLSFAGIAIQHETPTRNSLKSSSLLKSSSCSLGSLNHIQSMQVNNHATSVSRCSMETSSSLHTCNRKSYVSLTSHHVPLPPAMKNQMNPSEYGNGKYLTRLIDDDSDSAQTGSHPGGVHTNFGQPHNMRLPFTLGTKSPAFNVVTWLILSLLIVTIPYYVLETVQQTGKLNSFYKYQASHEYVEAQNHQQLLGAMVEFLFEFEGTQAGSNSTDEELSSTTVDDLSANFLPNFDQVKELRMRDQPGSNSFWEICSMWLSCICRILFLSILPLNGWLYGIRSRSLRATLRIVLKRYISRRQASIEINQRQRSISSIKSRESLFMNLPPLYYNHNSSVCAKCNYQITIKSPERVFRRCSSFTGLKQENQSNESASSQPYVLEPSVSSLGMNNNNDNNPEQNQAPTSNRQSCRGANSNTIRFLIGDCSSDRASDQFTTSQQQPATDGLMTQYCSHNTSPSLSLAGSDRSLVSASIYSAHSLLFDDRGVQECTAAVDFNHLSQKSIFKHGGAMMRGSPTKLAHDVLEKEISELDQTLKVIFDNSRSLSSVKRIKADLGVSGSLTTSSPPKSSVYPTTNSSLDCTNQKSTILIDRNSTSRGGVDLIEASKPLITSATNLENTISGSQGAKKPPEDFRFFITSAPGSEQHIVEVDQHGDKITTSRKKNVTIDLMTSGHPRTRLVNQPRDNQAQLSSDWWKELKLNLTRLINVTSVRLLPSIAVEPHRRETLEAGYGSVGWRNFTPKQVDELAKDSGSRALLTKSSSSNDRGSADRSQDLLIDPLGHLSDQVSSFGGRGIRTKKRMKNSVTLDDIKFMKNDDPNSHLECSTHQSSSSSSSSGSSGGGGGGGGSDYRKNTTKALDQSPTYLKPPNFLKLIFDPNSNTSHYSGPSALSPIKECSSNHSYASSQSSLNINSHHLIYQARHDDSLVSEYSNLME